MDTHSIINLIHIFIIVPFLLFVSIQQYNLCEQMFYFLMGLGGFVTLYHAYKLLLRYQKNSSYAWVNALHVFYVGPLLFYIGYKGKETSETAYQLLMLLTFAAGGYHLYELAIHSSMKVGLGEKIISMTTPTDH